MVNIDNYIERLKLKDNEAFRYVYDETKRGVYAMIISIVKDRQATEDLMQDTYIKMLKNIDQFTSGRDFNSWVVQIAKNTALDYYRKHQKTIITDPIENIHIIDTVQAETSSNAKNDYSLEEMIKPLNEEERQIILLHIVSEMKFKTIAETMSKPLGTILWMYQKALKKIKKSLEGEDLS